MAGWSMFEGVVSVDPDECLRRIREILQLDRPELEASRLVELVQALDEWIGMGGYLPKDWRVPVATAAVWQLRGYREALYEVKEMMIGFPPGTSQAKALVEVDALIAEVESE